MKPLKRRLRSAVAYELASAYKFQSPSSASGVEGHATYRVSDRAVTRELGGVQPFDRHSDSQAAGIKPGLADPFPSFPEKDPDT